MVITIVVKVMIHAYDIMQNEWSWFGNIDEAIGFVETAILSDRIT